jgi:hypothetical protein
MMVFNLIGIIFGEYENVYQEPDAEVYRQRKKIKGQAQVVTPAITRRALLSQNGAQTMMST